MGNTLKLIYFYYLSLFTPTIVYIHNTLNQIRYQYIFTKTNNFGAVLDQKLKYCFTYIGDDGQLHQFDDFEHTEYGLWKVCIGDENKYVVKDGFNTYRWLYLTEETFKNMRCK